MAKILFLAHRTPFPPDKGDKIRAFHVLRHLARRHDVWLGAGVDDARDLRHLPQARAMCREVHLAPLGPLRRGANMLWGAAAGLPLSVARFAHPGLERWVRRVLREVRPDIVFAYSSAQARYVAGRLPPETRLIVDLVDCDAEKWRAYAGTAGRPMRWVYGAEFHRLTRFEAGVVEAAEAAVFVSETERDLFARLAPGTRAKLHVIANGVDTDYFQAAAPPSGAPVIVFCGRMDYRPNVEGADWFAREVLPRVRAASPRAAFRIVGSAPTGAVLALAALPGVEVTGAVPDVRPHLAQAAVVVVPLRIARGVQNKLLEGMAAGRPVVATPQALDGIAARPGREVLVAGDAAAFADEVGAVLGGEAPADLGARARDFVLRRHRWGAQLEALDRLIDRPGPTASAQAAA